MTEKEKEFAEERRQEKRQKRIKKIEDNITTVVIWTLVGGFGLAILCVILYPLWWLFVGEWLFAGPFADDYNTWDVIWRTIVFLLVLLYFIAGFMYMKK